MRSDSRQRFAQRQKLPASDWRALLAPWIAVVVALAPLLGVLHRAFVPHWVCEHGDLIELDAERLASAEHENGAGHSARVDQAAGVASHGHDHCHLAALSRTASVLNRDRPSVQAELLIGLSHRSVEQPRVTRSILLLAPKTSPPTRLGSV